MKLSQLIALNAKNNNMKEKLYLKILVIDNNTVSLFVRAHNYEEFIGYISSTHYYFDKDMLEWYNLSDKQLLEEIKPQIIEGKFKLHIIYYHKEVNV